jgi:tetratricopeptide (TPR) repeat protein
MTEPCLSIPDEIPLIDPFEDRIDILFHELELATKWQRPSVLLAIYNSDDIRADADIALENRLHNLGQSTYHIRIKNQKNADVSLLISELADFGNVVFFIEGLRWEAGEDDRCTYRILNKSREFFIENQIRVVFWLTEHEAIDLAHFAPDYWAFRHRVIEFVDSPKSEQISSPAGESAWQGNGEFNDISEDLDAKIALRIALLADLPKDSESTSARANLLLTLGMLHWRKKDFEKASQYLNTALDLAAGLEDARFEASCFNAIALVDTDLGKTEEAIQAYKNAISLAPELISPWNNLGNLYRRLDQNEEALAAFQKAIEQNSSDAVAWNSLGDLQHALGHNDDAIYAYLKAIEFSPNYAPCWTGLGNSYMAEGQLDDALAAHLNAIEIDNQNIDSRFALGDIYKLQGKIEDAGMVYRTVIELDPNNAQARNKLGDLHNNSGAVEEDQKVNQNPIDCDQDSHPSDDNLASIYIQEGRQAEAIPLLQKEIELSTDDTDTISLWNQLGDAYRHLDDYEHAMAAYRNADALDPQKVSAPPEEPTTEPDPQCAPSEDFSVQPIENFKLRCMQEQGLPSEPTQSAETCLPEALPALDTEAPLPGRTSTILSWLDGLATFMATFHHLETTEPTVSDPKATGNLDENEVPLEMQFDQLEPIYPVFTKDGPIQSGTEAAANWYEPLSALPDSISAPVTPVINEVDETAQAETASQAAPATEEENAHLWNELGSIYLNTGAYDEAINSFKKAIELDETYGWSYNNLATLYIRQGQYKDAIPLYQKGLKYIQEAKAKALLWNRLGDAYRRLNEHDRAAAAYRKAMELDPDNVSLLTRARLSLLGNCRA